MRKAREQRQHAGLFYIDALHLMYCTERNRLQIQP